MNLLRTTVEGTPGRRRIVCVCLATALLAGCERQARPPDRETGLNILIISIDTLRADHLGCYGYFRDTSPEIDAFAREAVFFEQAYSPMSTTLPAHVSLLTGLHPLEHGILSNVGHGGMPFGMRSKIRSLAQVAQAAKYRTAAFVSATPLKRYSGIDVGFEVFDEPEGAARDADEVTDKVLAWVDLTSPQRFLLLAHYYDPHRPYSPPAPFDAMFGVDEELEEYLAAREVSAVIWPGPCLGSNVSLARGITNNYDGEVRFADREVGRLLRALRERGLWENTVIVLTSDHGEGLNQHDWPQHGRTWNEQVQIPLLMRFPQVREELPSRCGRLVSLMDVLPIVFGRYDWPWARECRSQFSGVDLLAVGALERPILSQRSNRACEGDDSSLFALTTPEWRYHLRSDGKERLFERFADPYELCDCTNARSGVVRGLASSRSNQHCADGVQERLAWSEARANRRPWTREPGENLSR